MVVQAELLCLALVDSVKKAEKMQLSAWTSMSIIKGILSDSADYTGIFEVLSNISDLILFIYIKCKI